MTIARRGPQQGPSSIRKSKYLKYDDFILANYEKMGPTEIGRTLGIRANIVCNRYKVILGRNCYRQAPAETPKQPSMPKVTLDR